MPQESPEEYFERLRRCVDEPAALHEQAKKHFNIFGRGAATISLEEVTQSWLHMHKGLGKTCGPGEMARLQVLFVAQAGPPPPGSAPGSGSRLSLECFELLYLEMLRSLLQSPVAPSSLGTYNAANSSSPLAKPPPSPQHQPQPHPSPPPTPVSGMVLTPVLVPMVVQASPVPSGAAAQPVLWTTPAALPEFLDSGRFRVEKRLGAGTFGEVFKAIELFCSRRVAIKRVAKMVDSDFLKEFAVLRELEHPNVLQATDHFEDEHSLYVVTEFIPGGSLADRLRGESVKSGCAPAEAWAAEVFRQVFAAIAYCHAQAVVHNDIKPDNILLAQADSAFPRVVVSDFGLASTAVLAGRSDGPPGDPRYAPPEAWEAEVNRGVGSTPGDVWMLGCTLFEVLSNGSLPFLFHRHTELKDFQSWMSADAGFRHRWVMSLRTTEPNWGAITAAAGAGPQPSAAALDCCARMLMKCPEQRPACAVMAEHPWLEEQRTAGQGASLGATIVEEARRRILAGSVTSKPSGDAPAVASRTTSEDGAEAEAAEGQGASLGATIAEEARRRILAGGVTTKPSDDAPAVASRAASEDGAEAEAAEGGA